MSNNPLCRLLIGVLFALFTLQFLGCERSGNTNVASESAVQKYDVEAGEAVESLRLVAQQAQVEFMYTVEDVEGIQTNQVSGYYSLDEALELMLKNTPLIFVKDDSYGYSIRTLQN